MDSIAVFGLGYVGLPLSLTYALYGIRVYGVDVNEQYVERLKRFETHVHEYYEGRSIEEILKESIIKGLFVPTTSYKEAIENAEALVVTVGIPINNGNLDFSMFESAVRNIGNYLRKGQTVLIRSTVPPGTTREVVLPILEETSGLKSGQDFYLAYSSERIAEGRAFEEFQTMPVAVGGMDELSARNAAELLKIINKNVIFASCPEVVETSKLLENSSRDVNIALVNEVAGLTERLGIDTKEVIEVANTHRRVKLLSPAVGVGGHCIPYSSKYIFYVSDKLGLGMELLHAARKVNNERPVKVMQLIRDMLEKCGKNIRDSKIAFIGVAMKDNSSDVSESPVIKMIDLAYRDGATVTWFDPLVKEDLPYRSNTLASAIKGADAIVISIQQPGIEYELASLSFGVKEKCILFDAKRIFSKSDSERAGFIYLTI